MKSVINHRFIIFNGFSLSPQIQVVTELLTILFSALPNMYEACGETKITISKKALGKVKR